MTLPRVDCFIVSGGDVSIGCCVIDGGKLAVVLLPSWHSVALRERIAG